MVVNNLHCDFVLPALVAYSFGKQTKFFDTHLASVHHTFAVIKTDFRQLVCGI